MSYNSNGRPIVKISQRSGMSWISPAFNFTTPEGNYRGKTPGEVIEIITGESKVRPVIEYQGKTSGIARQHFRSAVSDMEMPSDVNDDTIIKERQSSYPINQRIRNRGPETSRQTKGVFTFKPAFSY